MRKKLKRFADNVFRSNVLEPGKVLYDRVRGQWHSDYFLNQGPITLELGCGRAAYTLGLGQRFPHQNFVGVDIKGARLWAGSTAALQLQLQNVAFLRTQIEHLDQFFAPQEVDQIYITFPDPRPRDRDAKRRLTSPRFLTLYRQLMRPGGWVHLKTDNEALFGYTLAVLKDARLAACVATQDFYESVCKDSHYGIQTAYEQQFLTQGAKIKYVKFSFAS